MYIGGQWSLVVLSLTEGRVCWTPGPLPESAHWFHSDITFSPEDTHALRCHLRRLGFCKTTDRAFGSSGWLVVCWCVETIIQTNGSLDFVDRPPDRSEELVHTFWARLHGRQEPLEVGRESPFPLTQHTTLAHLKTPPDPPAVHNRGIHIYQEAVSATHLAKATTGFDVLVCLQNQTQEAWKAQSFPG